MFNHGDIVIVTCEHPSGVQHDSTKGWMGVVTGAENAGACPVYEVEHHKTTYLYVDSELRYPSSVEKEEKLKELLLLV